MTNEIQGLIRMRKQRVKLRDIDTMPDEFQHRDSVCDEYHAEALTRALKRKVDLPPVDVWRDPEGDKLIVMDGHHRLEAYRRVIVK